MSGSDGTALIAPSELRNGVDDTARDREGDGRRLYRNSPNTQGSVWPGAWLMTSCQPGTERMRKGEPMSMPRCGSVATQLATSTYLCLLFTIYLLADN